MKKQNKITEVQSLTNKVKSAKSVALVDYKGIKVKDVTQLRQKIREAGGELQVVKNNLLYRALVANKYKVDKNKFAGTTLAVFANKDEILPLKELVTFGKGLNLLPLKIGFMTGQILTAEDLNRFANLPPKIQLQAKLVSMLASQPQKLVYALNWNIQKLVMALGQIRDKKQ
ncbi:MAG: 50S ribosomal protein L10 [Patescibacteria group bacterium]|nr:50S ribosomal protein L10 [Patescibacteria group bacterium]